jgi:small subunit ribosomal protein S6
MFILESNAYGRDPGGLATKIKDLIENVGGKILASRLWNEQRLAYPIDGHRKGVYWLTYFELETTNLAKFNRAVQLTDPILRHLPLRLDPRLVEPMVAAARGEQPMVSRAAKMDAKENGEKAATEEAGKQAAVVEN